MIVCRLNILAPTSLFLVIIVASFTGTAAGESDFQRADKLLASGKYAEAKAIFLQIAASGQSGGSFSSFRTAYTEKQDRIHAMERVGYIEVCVAETSSDLNSATNRYLTTDVDRVSTGLSFEQARANDVHLPVIQRLTEVISKYGATSFETGEAFHKAQNLYPCLADRAKQIMLELAKTKNESALQFLREQNAGRLVKEEENELPNPCSLTNPDASDLKRVQSSSSAPAKFRLGTLYLCGYGLRKDVPKAVALFKLAASSKFPPATATLAFIYSRGQGVPRDQVKAFRLLLPLTCFYRAQQSVGFPTYLHYQGLIVSKMTSREKASIAGEGCE